ncbi:hypothetical protein [Roseibium sp.]|uniref:hypothetical protein n=1 Tax=Roseibium sp. TaxID=1936156 RepID=UPI00327FE354
MGILDGLFGGGQQMRAQAPGQGLLGDFGARMTQMQQTNPEAFIALGAGLLNGDMAQGAAGMGQAVGRYRDREADAGLQREGWDRADARFDKTFGLQQAQYNNSLQAQSTAKAQQAQQINQTIKWAESTGDPDVIGLAGAGMFDEAFRVWNAKNSAGAANDYGLTPMYGTDDQGNIVPMQLGKNGQAVRTAIPEGITPVSPYSLNADKARGTAVGKGMGEAQTELGGTLQTADRMLGVIDDVLNDPNRGAGTGASSIFNVIPATGGYDFNQKVKQLQGQAFLQAFESLKGGGQITEVEGMKAEQAIARLNTAQSEPAFEQALMDLKEVVQAGKQRAMQRAGGVQAQRPAPVNVGGYTIEQVD